MMKHPSPQPSSWIWSVLTVSTVALLLNAVTDWHATTKSARHATETLRSVASLTSVASSPNTQGTTYRLLVQVLQESPAIDDDITRDQTCRDYLMNFLNGTTDGKDTCQGMSNAWTAGDCKDDSGLHIVPIGRKHQTQDGNVTTDDILIDDFYENFECCASISSYYTKHCQEPQLDAVKLLGIFSVMVFCGLMKSLIRVAGLQWIPDAGACIVVGSTVGGILRLINHNVVRDNLAFNNDLFLQVLLPPIIFGAAISIDKRAFRRDIFPILTFAIFGTFFSAVAIGYITYYLSALGSGPGIPFLDSLIFGALMSSIDPVATLGILSSVGVSQGDTLYTLIFGESLLNDGVAIVLFDSLVRHMGDKAVVDQATVHDILYHFVIRTMGSILVGLVCGTFCTLYFWALQGKHTAVSEVANFFIWALIPYYIADAIGYSGIISIMVMGFMLDYYVIGGFQSDEAEWTDYMEMRCEGDSSHPVEPCFGRVKMALARAFCGRGHIMSRSRHHVGFVAEVISSIMETAIFAYLGLFLFNEKNWSFIMMSTGIFSCVSSRAGMVVLLAFLINACVWVDLESKLARCWRSVFRRDSNSTDEDSETSHTRVYLDRRTQIIIFSAGVRGAVSYALCQNIPVYDTVTKHGSHYKAELKYMTSATIVVVLFVFGALTYFTVQFDLSPNRERVAGPLTHRLMSIGLASDDENDEEETFSDLNATSLEIEGRPTVR
jgi:NhaP-type Na+/H+ or K+/H+ antiporter